MKAFLLTTLLAASIMATGGTATAVTDARWADFNGDGYSDLAIGSPYASVTFSGANRSGAGEVTVRYGSSTGLAGGTSETFTQEDTGGSPTYSENFGAAVASGDLDGDGFDDLVIGTPNDDNAARLSNGYSAGSVDILYGSASGLTSTGAQHWSQDSTDVIGNALRSDHFGSSVAVGDIDGDGFADVAIGVPGENIYKADDTRVVNPGMVNVLYGSASGLTAAGNQNWHQAKPGIEGAIEASDEFGAAVAFGDLNGDGFADLIVGSHYEDVGNLSDAGSVNVILGSASGLTSTGNSIWWQNKTDVPGSSESGDNFGNAVAAGDFDNDGYDELVVGIEGESASLRLYWTGAIAILPGSASGPTATGSAIWSQADLAGDPEDYDFFGASVATGDFDDDGYDDLGVGSPGEAIGSQQHAGAVNVVYGSAAGLTTTDEHMLTQSMGISGTTEVNDDFGDAVSAGDFDGDGYADLGVGAPGEYNASSDVVGAVSSFPGSASGLAGTDGWYAMHSGTSYTRMGSSLAG